MAASDDAAPPKRVLLVSARFSARAELQALKKLLEDAKIAVDVVGSLDEALVKASGPPPAEGVVLDASFQSDVQDARMAELLDGAVARARAAQPLVPVVVAATAPTSPLYAAAFRAGAADVVDLSPSASAATLKAFTRAAAEHRRRRGRQQLVDELRGVVDEFLRQLVRTERRLIELEESISPDDNEPEIEGAPRVLVVDDEAAVAELLVDHLARLGLGAIVADSGERALELASEAQLRREPIDMAMVDKNLPGMDGITLIQQLRIRMPSLPTMIMTGYSTADSAVAAADLGVVGYVLKPFSDVRELATRVKELAARYAAERRQRRHLARIKSRHAQFLARYSRITSELDRLKG